MVFFFATFAGGGFVLQSSVSLFEPSEYLLLFVDQRLRFLKINFFFYFGLYLFILALSFPFWTAMIC